MGRTDRFPMELAGIKSGYRNASIWLWPRTNHLTITSAPFRILGRQEKLFDLIRLMCKQRSTDSWKPRTVANELRPALRVLTHGTPTQIVPDAAGATNDSVVG